jgi:hypothetical protein
MSNSKRNKIKRLLLRDGFHCWLCHEIILTDVHHDDGMEASVDHYIPRSLGGRNCDENLKLAHRKCNGGRAKLFPDTLIFTEEEIARLTNPNHLTGGPSRSALKAKVRYGIDIKSLKVIHRERAYHPDMPIEKL